MNDDQHEKDLARIHVNQSHNATWGAHRLKLLLNHGACLPPSAPPVHRSVVRCVTGLTNEKLRGWGIAGWGCDVLRFIVRANLC
jgi:hypothetical protein